MNSKREADKAADKNQQISKPEPFISHLIELRQRILWSLSFVLIIFFALAPFANDLYGWFAEPLMSQLPEGSSMISTEPHGPFFVPFKFTFFIAIALAIPFLIYQIWAFIAPGLYQNEKRIIFPLIFSSTLLFYLGILFAYYVVFPLMFNFFANTAPEGVAVMTDINAYMGFSLKLFFAFGLAFEVPIATVLLAKMGVVSVESMTEKRPYVILFAFIIGMLMTPPDVLSQILLAIPVCLLFELGLFCAKLLVRKE